MTKYWPLLTFRKQTLMLFTQIKLTRENLLFKIGKQHKKENSESCLMVAVTDKSSETCTGAEKP